MRNLYFCNTTYQLLFCINIAIMMTGDDTNDIILSDRTDFTVVAENLKKERIFDNITIIRSKEWDEREERERPGIWRRRLHLISSYAHLEKWMSEEYDLTLPRYDAFFACNMKDHVVAEVYAVLAQKNKNLRFYEIEDGFGTYIAPPRFSDSERLFKRISLAAIRVPYLTEGKITKTILFFPELYMNEDHVPKERLPLMDLRDPEIQGLMQRIFGCEGTHLKKRFILLEESFRADGFENNSDQLLTEVIDLVGRENVLLKTHPRNGRSTYGEREVEAYDAPVAWEALIASENIDDKVLVTCLSGSAVNSKLLYGSKCKIIFLYKLLEGDAGYLMQFPATRAYFDKFAKKFDGEVFVPATHGELRQVIEKLENGEK